MLPRAARDVCAAPLAHGHQRIGGQALDRSAAADALPLEAALLHLDTDFELHRLSHRPGDAAVSRPTTRRVLVVLLSSLAGAAEVPALLAEEQPGHEATVGEPAIASPG
jgi:hypothetical protein